jgi:hypothetical protein
VPSGRRIVVLVAVGNAVLAVNQRNIAVKGTRRKFDGIDANFVIVVTIMRRRLPRDSVTSGVLIC